MKLPQEGGLAPESKNKPDNGITALIVQVNAIVTISHVTPCGKPLGIYPKSQ